MWPAQRGGPQDYIKGQHGYFQGARPGGSKGEPDSANPAITLVGFDAVPKSKQAQVDEALAEADRLQRTFGLPLTIQYDRTGWAWTATWNGDTGRAHISMNTSGWVSKGKSGTAGPPETPIANLMRHEFSHSLLQSRAATIRDDPRWVAAKDYFGEHRYEISQYAGRSYNYHETFTEMVNASITPAPPSNPLLQGVRDLFDPGKVLARMSDPEEPIEPPARAAFRSSMTKPHLALLDPEADDETIDGFLSALGAGAGARDDELDGEDRGVAQDYIKGQHGYFQGARPKGGKAEDPTSPAALERKAKDVFGTTEDIHEAGYITPDGTMLDFSGRHQSAGYVRVGDKNVPEATAPKKYYPTGWEKKQPPGSEGADYLAGGRNVDHRDVYDVVPDDLSGMSGDDRMHQLVNAGFIRVISAGGSSPGSPPEGSLGLEINLPMTSAQRSVISAAARQYESLGVDVVDQGGTTVAIHDNWQKIGYSNGSVISDANESAAGKAVAPRADELELFEQRFMRGGPQDWTKGEHGWFSGSKPGGPVSPATMGGIVPAKGRQEIATGDPTRWANLPPELQAKILAKMQERFPGITQEDLAANVEKQYLLGIKDPTNNGKTWYQEANNAAAAIAAENGYTLDTAVGGLAGLSPQMEWGANLAAAKYTAKMVHDNPLVDKTVIGPELYGEAGMQLAKKNVAIGDWDGSKHLADLSSMEAAAYIKQTGKAAGLSYVDDQTGKTRKVSYSSGLNGLDDAVQVFRGGSPDEVLNGHKVRSFYNNIRFPGDPGGFVTVDTHALSAAVGMKVTAKDDRMDVLSTPTSRPDSVKGAYSLFADAYRSVAAKYGLLPQQVQATAWIQWRKTESD